MPKKLSLLDVLASVSADDLAEIDQRMEALQKELDTLAEARRLINVKVNGKPERKIGSRKKPAAAANSSGETGPSGEIARKAAQLLTTNGVMTVAKLAEKLNATYQAVYKAVQHPVFAKTEQGIALSPEGKRVFGVD
jgi:hypothetical protein